MLKCRSSASLLKCPELSKLPTAPRYTSIWWKHQTPGQFLGPGESVDPLHPASKLAISRFPRCLVKSPLETQVVPFAALRRPVESYPFQRWLLPWSDRLEHAKKIGFTASLTRQRKPILLKEGLPIDIVETGQIYPEVQDVGDALARFPQSNSLPKGRLALRAMKVMQRRVPMSCLILRSKKRMGDLRVTRRDIGLRLKAALNLIVSRGAYYGDASTKNKGYLPELYPLQPERPVMQFDDADTGRKWIMQGWTYVFTLNKELLRMPYHQLIPTLRSLLLDINEKALALEHDWLAASLLKEARTQQMSKAAENEFSVSISSKLPKPLPAVIPRFPPRPIQSFDNTQWRKQFKNQLKLMD